VKNCLASFGTLVLLVLGASALLLSPLYMDELYDLAFSIGLPVELFDQGEVLDHALALARLHTLWPWPLHPPVQPALPTPGSIEITNLVAAAPLPTPTAIPTPTPDPTPTPVPNPVEYRTRVLIRARHFSTALDIFMDTSRRLDGDANLLTDPHWRSEINAALDEFVASAVAMGAVEPVPPEYSAVDEWLDRAGSEAKTLRDHYWAGVETGNRQYFEAVGASLNQIVENMAQAQQAMIASGWGP
jgi:hypothetical protein